MTSPRGLRTPFVRRTLAAFTLVAASTLPCGAQSINFDIGPDLPVGSPAASYGAVANQPGPWNQVAGGSSSFGGPIGGGSFLDTLGQPTPIQTLMTNSSAQFCSPPSCNGVGPVGSVNARLLHDYARVTNVGEFVIQGLAPGYYDLYVYAFSSNPTLVNGVPVSGGTWPGAHASGRTYALQMMVPVAEGNPLKIEIEPGISAFSPITLLQGIQLVYHGPSLGTSFCQPAPNSTGLRSKTISYGAPFASANLFVLSATGLPFNTFGIFLTSRTQGFTPNAGGSAGNLCLSGPIGRQVGGQIYGSGQGGWITSMPDLTQQPTPTGLVAVMPGETWYFQAWFRDVENGTQTSNYSDGQCVTFQ